MRKICFITGSRADYGIMSSLIRKVAESKEAILQIVATNMHLSESYGMTVNEILEDGFKIDRKVDSLLDMKDKNTTDYMAATLEGMGKALAELKPDLVVILGDRYEMLGSASAATLLNIPIAHLHGGEISEGAYDETIRHAITKLSTLHFASTKEYAERIVRMGEAPERVFHVGAPGVENILQTDFLSLKELEHSIGYELGEKYFVVAFHPATKEPGEEITQTIELTKALEKFIPIGYKFLVTLPNSDTGGKNIADILIKWGEIFPESVKTITSLGRKRFFSALKYSQAIIGNSSAGIIEAPTFRIPTINIGNRQKGRTAGPSVIHSSSDHNSIEKDITFAITPDFQANIKNLALEDLNPYFKPDTSSLILDRILHSPLPLTKPFYDI